MEFFPAFVDLVWGNLPSTFVIVLFFGFIWIYFQIQNIKTKTAPPQRVINARKELVDAKKSWTIYSLLLFVISLSLCYFLYSIEEGSSLWIFVLPAQVMALICFLTAAGMQIMNKMATNVHINQGISK
jgi:hypothetical protein